VNPNVSDTTTDALISLRGVTKSFGSHTVLQDISFDIPRGKISAIMGPSGTGKSVLLKNIIGLLRPDRGEIWVDGEETVRMREKDMYRVRRKFGVLFQDGALFGSLNLYDNIAFPLREHTKKSE
jgi:phospholipid/cholesterol/gamma-HCH transport system ATP-binding protein